MPRKERKGIENKLPVDGGPYQPDIARELPAALADRVIWSS
jgi:hypothetical protein